MTTRRLPRKKRAIRRAVFDVISEISMSSRNHVQRLAEGSGYSIWTEGSSPFGSTIPRVEDDREEKKRTTFGTEARVEGHGESDASLLVDPRPQQSHLLTKHPPCKTLQ